jgi:hypothetical protein
MADSAADPAGLSSGESTGQSGIFEKSRIPKVLRRDG